ncbi:MAG: hypothetical protein ACREDY_08925, partial [Bradyrhizobium sp.]
MRADTVLAKARAGLTHQNWNEKIDAGDYRADGAAGKPPLKGEQHGGRKEKEGERKSSEYLVEKNDYGEDPDVQDGASNLGSSEHLPQGAPAHSHQQRRKQRFCKSLGADKDESVQKKLGACRDMYEQRPEKAADRRRDEGAQHVKGEQRAWPREIAPKPHHANRQGDDDRLDH